MSRVKLTLRERLVSPLCLRALLLALALAAVLSLLMYRAVHSAGAVGIPEGLAGILCLLASLEGIRLSAQSAFVRRERRRRLALVLLVLFGLTALGLAACYLGGFLA